MKKFKRLLLYNIVLVSLVLLFGFLTNSVEANSTEKVCTGYDVKVDLPDSPYSDTYVNITLTSETASWSANEGYEITSACVKIGGPGGGTLILFGAGDGSYTTDSYGISHVAVNYGEIEETPEPSETPEPTETPEPSETPEPTSTVETLEPTETPELTETLPPQDPTPTDVSETPETPTETPSSQEPTPTQQMVDLSADLPAGGGAPSAIMGGNIIGFFLAFGTTLGLYYYIKVIRKR